MKMVETVDHKGIIGSPIPIIDAHRTGAAHRAVSIVVWNAARTKMLITRRAAVKATWPGFWSNAVCSHPLPGEPYIAAARRRLREELRISGSVAPAFRMYYGPVRCPVSGMLEHEMDHVFRATVPESTAFTPDPGEVSGLQWVDRAQVAAFEKSGQLTPWFVIILRRIRWPAVQACCSRMIP